MKITKRVIDTTKPAAGADLFVWDSELKGFGFRVRPSGHGTFVLQFRNAHGRSRRIVLGRVGELTPDEARRLARDHLAAVRHGDDPAEARRAARKAVTVAELVALYLTEGRASNPAKKASSWKTDELNLRRHVLPLLGGKPAVSLTRRDIERWHADVAAGKTAIDERTRRRGRAIVEGGKGAAGRCLSALSAMLSWAVHRGLLETNPATGVKRFPGRTCERFLSAQELARLGDALTALVAVGKLSPFAAAAVRFLMLTGLRRGEALALRWTDVDFEAGVVRLADSKTGPRPVVLAAPALALLAELPRVNAWVFPSNRADGAVTLPHNQWCAIRDAAALPGLRLHDLRHSFASVAVAGGESLFLTAKLLGHAKTVTTERYAHLSDDPLRAAADRTAKRIAEALAGPVKDRSGDVVPLAGKRR